MHSVVSTCSTASMADLPRTLVPQTDDLLHECLSALLPAYQVSQVGTRHRDSASDQRTPLEGCATLHKFHHAVSCFASTGQVTLDRKSSPPLWDKEVVLLQACALRHLRPNTRCLACIRPLWLSHPNNLALATHLGLLELLAPLQCSAPYPDIIDARKAA